MPLIDLHSHHQPKETDIFTILNIHTDFEKIPVDGRYSVGLHPWYLKEETVHDEFKKFEKAAEQDNVLAIGECGLDKAVSIDWALQEKWFIRQIGLANKLKKPLIIHCVRAYDEVLSLLETLNNGQPVVFHGFNKNTDLARRIIDKGHFLSFGKHLSKNIVGKALASLPSDRFLLETDTSEIPISEIYLLASGARSTTIDSIIEQIDANFESVFGKPAIL